MNRLTVSKQKKLLSIAAYTIGFCCLYLTIFLIFYREGKSFVKQGDTFAENLTTLAYIRRFLTSHFHTPQFDFTIGYGEDAAAPMSYTGLYNPVGLISVLLAGSNLTLAVYLLYAIKFYLSGLSFLAYCFYKDHYSAAFVGAALIYSIGISAITFFQFTDIYYTFPLALIGVETLSDKRNTHYLSFWFILSCVLQGVNTWYFLYMQLVVVSLYFVLRTFLQFGKHFIMPFFRYALNVVISLLLIGPVFLPGMYTYFHSSRSSGRSTYQLGDFLPNLDFIKNVYGPGNILMPSYLSDNLLIFLPLLIFFGCCLLLFSFKKHLLVTSLLLVSLYCSTLPFVGSLFNGFSYSTDRGFFFIFFLLCYGMALGLEDGTKRILPLSIAYLLCLGMALYCVHNHHESLRFLFYSMALLSLLFGVYLFPWSRRIPFLLPGATFTVILLSRMLQMDYSFDYIGICGEGKYPSQHVWDYVDISDIRELDSPTYKYNQYAAAAQNTLERCDYIYDNVMNHSIYAGYPATNEYFSLYYAGYDSMKSYLSTFHKRSYGTCGTEEKRLLQDLFHIRYYEALDTGDILVNDDLLPLCTFYPRESIISWVNAYQMTPLERYAQLLDAMIIDQSAIRDLELEGYTLDNMPQNLTPITPLITYSNTEPEAADGCTYLHLSQDSSICLEIPEAYQNMGDYYLRFSGYDASYSDQSAGLNIGAIPGHLQRIFDDSFLICKPDGNGQVLITSDKDIDITFQAIEVFCFPETSYQQALEHRRSVSPPDYQLSNDCLVIQIEAPEDGWAFLPVANTGGWKAFVDTLPTDIYTANYCFISVPISAGTHELILKYQRPLQNAGYVSLLLGIFLLGGVIYLQKKKA